MKNKHTQGEWKAALYGDGCRIFSERNGAIAQIPHEGKHKEEHEANAKLIAAAPKLLENLKEMVHMFWANETTYNREGFLSKYPNHYIFDAEAVIKEATV